MTRPYHVRKWLNKRSSSANSTVSAFHGTQNYLDTNTNQKVSYTETQFKLSDCHGSVRIHVLNNDMPAFIAKLRLIEATCRDFAVYLEGEQE